MTTHREQRGLPSVADILEQHISCSTHAHQWESDTLPTQGLTAHADELGVFATEPRDDVGSKDIDYGSQDNQKSSGNRDAKLITLLDTRIEFGPIVIASHGLEPLSEPDDNGETE